MRTSLTYRPARRSALPSRRNSLAFRASGLPASAPFPWTEVTTIGSFRRSLDRFLKAGGYIHHTMAAETLLFRLFTRQPRCHQFELYLNEEDPLELWRPRAPLRQMIASIFAVAPASIEVGPLHARYGGDEVHYYSLEDRLLFGWALENLLKGFPVQELKSQKVFFGRTFFVTPRVGHIASEYEAMVNLVLDLRKKGLASNRRQTESFTMAEIGSGPGQMGCTVALEIPGARVDLIDINPHAEPEANRHIRYYGLEERVRFHQSDVFLANTFRGKTYDIITASPYPAALELLQRCIAESRALLHAGGFFVLQFQDGTIMEFNPMSGTTLQYLPEVLVKHARESGYGSVGILKTVRGPSIFLIATPRAGFSFDHLKTGKTPPEYYKDAFTPGAKPAKVSAQRRLAILIEELRHDLAAVKHIRDILADKFQDSGDTENLIARASRVLVTDRPKSSSDYDEVIFLAVRLAKILEDHGRDKTHLRLRYLEKYDYVFGPVLGFVNHSVLMDALQRRMKEVKRLRNRFLQEFNELAKADKDRHEAIAQILSLDRIQPALDRAKDWMSLTTAFFMLKRNHYGELVVPTHFDNWYMMETALVEHCEELDRLKNGLQWALTHLHT